MKSMKNIAERVRNYEGENRVVEPDQKIKRALKSELSLIEQCIITNSTDSDENGSRIVRLGVMDMEDIGRMQYLLDSFFPNGVLPEEFKRYQNFINRQMHVYEDTINQVIESKFRRDRAVLNRAIAGDATPEATEDIPYAASLVNILETEETKERNKVVIRYDGQPLYEERLPESVFQNLPVGTTIVLDYTTQRLVPNIQETLKASSSKDKTGCEKAVLESLAKSVATRDYLNSIHVQINRQIYNE